MDENPSSCPGWVQDRVELRAEACVDLRDLRVDPSSPLNNLNLAWASDCSVIPGVGRYRTSDYF